MNYLSLHNCLSLKRAEKHIYATPPPYSPNVVNQTVDFGGATWKGQPGGGWTLQRENPQATNYSATPQKHDINPATGKAYAINPQTGLWDDNYWSQVAEPALKNKSGSNIPDPGIPASTPATASFNLPDLYKSLYQSSGISDIESQLSAMDRSYAETKAKINDNPFLSEATRVGRLAKMDSLYQDRTRNIRNDIATKKADIETQLNLQTKQFDINSQVAQQALSNFQTLLQLGAYDNATGEDIAQITRSTGLSSSMIKSAIDLNIKKNTPEEKPADTQIISFDDGDNQGFALINTQTGEIINKQVVAGSTPTASEVKAQLAGGTSGGSSGGSTKKPSLYNQTSQLLETAKNSYGHVNPAIWNEIMNFFISNGGKSKTDFINNYKGYADPNRGDFEKAYGFKNPNS